MLNWIRAHPVWAGIGAVVLAYILYVMLFSDGGTDGTGSAIATVEQDPSVVAAGQQLQALQIQTNASTQQAQLAATLESERNATQFQIAQLSATLSNNQTAAQQAIAAQQIASNEKIVTLQSTLAQQIEAARIAASTQDAQLQATTALQIQKTQADMMTAIQQSNTQTQIAIQQSNAEVQKQLIASNAQVATAQIKANKKRCFVTTAYVDHLGLPDDCDQLVTLRKWRDDWLMVQDGGAALVAVYYECAPRVLAVLETRANYDRIISGLGRDYIDPCIECVGKGDNIGALKAYVDMMICIGRYYDSHTMDALERANARGIVEHITEIEARRIGARAW